MQMTDSNVRAIIALVVIIGFFGLMLIILIGVVNITDPVIAKMVGSLVGYVTAMLNPIIMRYFREPANFNSGGDFGND